MDLRPLGIDEREPSKLTIEEKSNFSTARDYFGEFVKGPSDPFGVKRRPTLSGAGDSERYDANTKDTRPINKSKSMFSKAVPKELADLLSDFEVVDILGRRHSTEQFNDHSKASLKKLENSP